ncbi:MULTISPECIES: DUF2849 domain-containing protein [Erysipelotrichaceae]|uniref:DUF2849 domain-containing protein n=1 Tax=Erysipelotrichaceae TaxID=128827 RepID=UPI00259B8DF9|nr:MULTISPECIES: DUF2849 domain-containing protein [Erysipelotrichaceae]
MKLFEVGKEYFIGNAAYTVVKRTAKTVTLKHYGETKRYSVKAWPCGEVVLTDGTTLYASHDEAWQKRIAEREMQEEAAAAAYRRAGEAADARQFQRLLDCGIAPNAAIAVMNEMRESISICG